jgi:hypothetical protein
LAELACNQPEHNHTDFFIREGDIVMRTIGPSKLIQPSIEIVLLASDADDWGSLGGCHVPASPDSL